MPFSRIEFADDTEFERFVLQQLGEHRVRVAGPGAIYDARSERPPNIVIRMTGVIMSGEREREELLASLRALAFGAAFKVLDLLVEHVLRVNVLLRSRMPFVGKVQALGQGVLVLPTPLDVSRDAWDRLVALYGTMQEARHAFTHRRSRRTSAGDLEIYDEQGHMVDTVSSKEIAAFTAAVHAAAELVIDGDDDRRRVNIVVWHLDTLSTRHQLPLLGAQDPTGARRELLIDLLPLEGGAFRIDLRRIREIIDGQPKPSLWDLRLYWLDHEYLAMWEDVTIVDDVFDFDAAAPPAWLSRK